MKFTPHSRPIYYELAVAEYLTFREPTDQFIEFARHSPFNIDDVKTKMGTPDENTCWVLEERDAYYDDTTLGLRKHKIRKKRIPNYKKRLVDELKRREDVKKSIEEWDAQKVIWDEKENKRLNAFQKRQYSMLKKKFENKNK